jgi:hypothetical protein
MVTSDRRLEQLGKVAIRRAAVAALVMADPDTVWAGARPAYRGGDSASPEPDLTVTPSMTLVARSASRAAVGTSLPRMCGAVGGGKRGLELPLIRAQHGSNADYLLLITS